MVGRQLPFIALLLPFYVMGIYGGAQSIRALWPMLLVAGGSFAAAQFVSSNYLDYSLTDVLAALTSLIVTLAFLKVWSPRADPAYAVDRSLPAPHRARRRHGKPAQRVPRLAGLAAVGHRIGGRDPLDPPENRDDRSADLSLARPCTIEVFITLYKKAYAANWVFQPLGTGTAILVASIITAACVGVGPAPLSGRASRAPGARAVSPSSRSRSSSVSPIS